MTSKLEVLNEGLHGWRHLPAGLFRLAMSLWELSDSKPKAGPWVHGVAKVSTIARYANLGPAQTQRALAKLRSEGLLETKVKAGRCLRFRLRAHASMRVQHTHPCDSSTRTDDRAIVPIVLTPSFSSSSSPYPLHEVVA